jgi:hypothetical protein
MGRLRYGRSYGTIDIMLSRWFIIEGAGGSQVDVCQELALFLWGE